ncbi:MAG: DEAD/DEAH box helicase, partial [Promethearchaeota archaeon]
MSKEFFDLPLLRPHTVWWRLYQEVIFATATQKNTLVVLPTGMGKTVIAIVLTAYRLEKEPHSKIVMLAPTRPLVGQHCQRFQQMLIILPEKFQVITGETHRLKRVQLWERSSLLFMTPQTLRHDLDKQRYDLAQVSLLIFDEAHRAVGGYDYINIADYYVNQRANPSILALTASPGNVRALCGALYIESIESRTEEDGDIVPYVQPVGVEYIAVSLPQEFLRIEELLRRAIQGAVMPLVELRFIKLFQMDFLGRHDLLEIRAQIFRMMKPSEGSVDPRLYRGLLGIALALRIFHAREILQTQGVPQLVRYFSELETKANQQKNVPKNVRILVTSPWYEEAKLILDQLTEKGYHHPKHPVLLKVVGQQLAQKPKSRILVFTRFRVSAAILTEYLNRQPGIKAARFVGQASHPGDKGLTQREQLALLDEFRVGAYNVLVATNVGEEGLDISECNLVVFYDSVPSAIRRIQRAGRTGRQAPGRLVALIAKGTYDERYHKRSAHKQLT